MVKHFSFRVRASMIEQASTVVESLDELMCTTYSTLYFFLIELGT